LGRGAIEVITDADLRDLLMLLDNDVTRRYQNDPMFLEHLRSDMEIAKNLYDEIITSEIAGTKAEAKAGKKAVTKALVCFGDPKLLARVVSTNKGPSAPIDLKASDLERYQQVYQEIHPGLKAQQAVRDAQDALRNVLPILERAATQDPVGYAGETNPTRAANDITKQRALYGAVGVLMESLKQYIPDRSSLWREGQKVSPASHFIHHALEMIGIKVGIHTVAKLTLDDLYTLPR
jgi:hypothetical protein